MRKHRAIAGALALAGVLAALVLVLVTTALSRLVLSVGGPACGPSHADGKCASPTGSSGKNSLSPMVVDKPYSSKQATAYLNPDCSGHTGPIRAWFDKTGPWIIGPDLTVTGAVV